MSQETNALGALGFYNNCKEIQEKESLLCKEDNSLTTFWNSNFQSILVKPEVKAIYWTQQDQS